MAGSSFLLLIDDIATLLDDVAAMTKVAASKSVAMADDVSVMTKVAAQKTAGVLGDDLALNAQQVAGVTADRELPVVWAVAKGSMVNKAILVPAALAISAFAPWAVTPLLMVGGAYLCFEGFEKVAYKYLHSPAEEDARRAERVRVVTDVTVDLVVFEKNKSQGGGAHRLRVVRRDHRHHAGHGGGSPVHAASGCPDRDRPDHDSWRLWLCGWNRETR
jgi:predicted DNA repair protein MutK